MKTKIAQIISVLMLAITLIGSQAQPGYAAVQTATQEPATAQPSGPIDLQELEAFLDNTIEAEMIDKHIPGVMVSVVQDGSQLLAKGYGYADLDGQVPMDPERTLFRIASVSKLFTWTAVMQLVERGQLSLDTDVNEYLDFTIPATFPESITLRHLLSHTPGFEDENTNTFKLQAGQVSPLGVYLKTYLPARVFPPGEVLAYSNYGAALAGYIVERVSGMPFNDYVEQNIFSPLGMSHTTFRQPLPEILATDLAIGYNYANGQYIAGDFVFVQPYPCGSMSATATDMAHFMIAHLQNGELDGQRILQEDTASQMHSQLYTADPRLKGGMAHGFFENMVNGQRIIWHGGNLITFYSGLYLIPEKNVGLFISTNSNGGAEAIRMIVNAFFDRYYPAPELSAPQSAAGFAERIAPYLGEYTGARSNFTSFGKMKDLPMPTYVSLGSNNTLVLSGFSFVEIEPGLLQSIDYPSIRIVYHTDPHGRKFLMGVTGINGDPFSLFRTPWYGKSNLHLLLFVSSTLLFLGAMVAWAIGFFVGRRKGRPASQPAPLPARLARWAATLFGLLWLASLLGIGSIFADIIPDFGYPRLFFEIPPMMNIVLTLAVLLGGLALAVLVFAVLAWVRRYWSLGGRIFYSLLALMALLLTWSLMYWNLLL